MYSFLFYILFFFSCSTELSAANWLTKGAKYIKGLKKNQVVQIRTKGGTRRTNDVGKNLAQQLKKENLTSYQVHKNVAKTQRKNLRNLSEQQTDSKIIQSGLTKIIKKKTEQTETIALKTENPNIVIEGTKKTLDTFAEQKTEEFSQERLKNEVQHEVNNQLGNNAPEDIKLQLSEALSESIFSHNVLREVVKESIRVKGEILKQIVSNTLKTIQAQKNVKDQDRILSIEESKEKQPGELSTLEQQSVETAIELSTNPEKRAKINQLSEEFTSDPELKQELDTLKKEENITSTDIFSETVKDAIEQKEANVGTDLMLQQEGYGSIKLDNTSKNLITEKLPETKELFENNTSSIIINPETNVLSEIVNTDSNGNSTIIFDGLKNITPVPENVNEVVNTIVEQETEKALKEIPSLREVFENPEKIEAEKPTEITKKSEKEEIQIEEIEEEPVKPEKKEITLSEEQISAIEAEKERVKALQQEAAEELLRIKQLQEALKEKPEEVPIEELRISEAKQMRVIEKETKTFQTISKKHTRIFEQQSDVIERQRKLDTQTDTKITRVEKKMLNETIENLKNLQSEILDTTQQKIQDVIAKTETKPEMAEIEIESIKKESGEKLTENLEQTHDIIDGSEIKNVIAKEYANDTASLISETADRTLETIAEEGKNSFDYIRLQDPTLSTETAKQILGQLKERLRTETEKYKKIVNQLARRHTKGQRQQKTQEQEITQEARNTQKALLVALVSTITTIVSTIAINNYLKEEVEEVQELITEAEELLKEEVKIPETPEAKPEVTEKGVEEKKATPKKLIPKIHQYSKPLIDQFAEMKNKVIPIAIETPEELKPQLRTITPQRPPTFERSMQDFPGQDFSVIDQVQRDAFRERHRHRQENNLDTLGTQLENTEQKVEKKLEEIEKKAEKKEKTKTKKPPKEEKKPEEAKKEQAREKVTGRPDYHGFDYGFDDFDFDHDYDFFDGEYDFDFDAFDAYDDFDDLDFLSKFYDDRGRIDTDRKQPVEKVPGFDQIALEGEFDMPEKVTQKKERKTERIKQSEIREEVPEIKEEIVPLEEEATPRISIIPTYKTYLAPALIVIAIGCAILFYFLI